MPQIKTDHTPNLYYFKSGNGPAIVLIHGFPESGVLFDGILSGIAERYTVIVPDLPGSGNSSIGNADTIHKFADCINDILITESIDEAIIAGHSMGGYVALAFAQHYPGKVAGLSLIHSTPFADTQEKKDVRAKAISIIEKGGKRPFITQMVTNLFATDFRSANPDAVAAQIAQSLKIEDASLVNYYKAMIGRADTTSILPHAAYPVQWILGKKDELMPYKIILERCLLAPVNFVSLYSNCGHMSMFEAPVKLLADLLLFADYCKTIKVVAK